MGTCSGNEMVPSCPTPTPFPEFRSRRPRVGMRKGLPARCVPVHLGRVFRKRFIGEERKTLSFQIYSQSPDPGQQRGVGQTLRAPQPTDR